MGEKLVLAGILHRSETYEPRMISAIADESRFVERIRGSSAYACDTDHRLAAAAVGTVHLVGDQFKDRSKQRMLRSADGKLSRMNADGQAACAGVEVISYECSLAPLVELATLIQCQWTGGDDQSAPESVRSPFE